MDVDGLPIVGAGIDYTRVDPFNQKRTLAFLNHFLIRTTSFLNHFAAVCDEKLEKLLIRIQRLEASMSILEAKLASIPGLESVTVESSTSVSNVVSQEKSEAQPTPDVQARESISSTHVDQQAAPPEVPSHPVDAEKPTVTISQDPRYVKYFKMVNVGIPVAAVKQKMLTEGVDPNLLDNPEAPAPQGVPSTETDKDDSDSSSFSD